MSNIEGADKPPTPPGKLSWLTKVTKLPSVLKEIESPSTKKKVGLPDDVITKMEEALRTEEIVQDMQAEADKKRAESPDAKAVDAIVAAMQAAGKKQTPS